MYSRILNRRNLKMKTIRKFIVLAAISLIASCGGNSGSNSTSTSPSNITMQTGQWEINAGVDADGSPLYVEGDIQQQSDTAYFTTSNNTVEYSFGGNIAGFVDAIPGDASLQITVSSNSISGVINPPFESCACTEGSGEFSGTINANGSQITGAINSVNVLDGSPVNGPFTAYVVTPVKGSFNGSDGDGSSATQATLVITILNGVVSGSGTYGGDSFVLNTSQSNFAVGAVFEAQGTITTINGAFPISIIGHQNAAGTQINLAFSTDGADIQTNNGGFQGTDTLVLNQQQ